MQNIAITILTLFLALAPLSLILIFRLATVFSKNHPKLGNVSVVLTGINGILTEESLFVRSIYFERYKLTSENNTALVSLINLDDKKEILVDKKTLPTEQALELTALITRLCHHKKTRQFEESIKDFLKNAGFLNAGFMDRYDILQQLPINDEKKITTVIARNLETKEIFSFSKGNPYKILEKCTRIYLDNKKVDLNYQNRRKIRKKIKELNRNGQKAIAFAFKALPLKKLENYTENFAETEMAFISLIGVTNPLKKNVKGEVEALKELGVKTYILTEEKEKKAAAIGRLQGVINPQYFECITGPYLEQLSDQKLKKIFSQKDKDFIFAELKKKHKEIIVNALKEMGETMAILNKEKKTGFKKLLHDVKTARLIQKNRKKLIFHAVPAKLALFLVLALSLLLKNPLLLTIPLILILEFIINLPLQLSLRYDQNNNTAPAIKKKLVILKTSVIFAILCAIYIFYLYRYGWQFNEIIMDNEMIHIKSATLIFLIFSIIQVIRAVKIKKIISNPYPLLISIIIALIYYLIFTVERVRDWLNLTLPDIFDWQILIYVTIIYLIIEWALISKKRTI